MIKYKARRLTPPEFNHPYWKFPQVKYDFYGAMETVERIMQRFPSPDYEVIIEGEVK